MKPLTSVNAARRLLSVLILTVLLIGAVCLTGCSEKTESAPTESTATASRYVNIKVVSNSMMPTFHYGDVVAVDTEYDPDSLAVGDIIAFPYSMDGEAQGFDSLHRIVKIVEKDSKKYYKTKGDDNVEADMDLVPADSVIGKYDHIVSKYQD